jgi:hypothetical protein
MFVAIPVPTIIDAIGPDEPDEDLFVIMTRVPGRLCMNRGVTSQPIGPTWLIISTSESGASVYESVELSRWI